MATGSRKLFIEEVATGESLSLHLEKKWWVLTRDLYRRLAQAYEDLFTRKNLFKTIGSQRSPVHQSEPSQDDWVTCFEPEILSILKSILKHPPGSSFGQRYSKKRGSKRRQVVCDVHCTKWSKYVNRSHNLVMTDTKNSYDLNNHLSNSLFVVTRENHETEIAVKIQLRNRR